LVKDFIEVEALPKDLPKEIVVDVSYIDDLSETIFVKDLEISSAVEIKDDLDKVVVTVIELKDIPEEEEEPTVDAAGEPIDGTEAEEDS